MRPKTKLFAALSFCALFGVTFSSLAEVAELTRLKGYDEQRREGRQFDKARESGEKAFLEEEEQRAEARNRAIAEHRKTQKTSQMSDDGPEAKADAQSKALFQAEREKNRKEYSRDQEFDRSKYPGLVTEAQELGLDEIRPRFDFKKRMATKKSGGSSSSGGSSGSGFSRGAAPGFPPPPTTFDDFGTPDGGFVPAPNVPDDFGDIPPPPPPPPPPVFDEGFGGGTDFGNDFIPPPPPPFESDGTF